MPSPFPGMDPWLESGDVFPDLHHALIFLLREGLNLALPPGYYAAAANRVWIDDEARREPDVSLLSRDDPPPVDDDSHESELEGMVAVATARVPDPVEEPYLEIYSHVDKRLVTAIEVLSLANKRPGKNGRVSYQQKQGELRAGGVHLVEIDLLRAGTHTTAVPRAQLLPHIGPFDYHVCVTVADVPTRFFARAIRLADPLPTIRVPLDDGVPPVPLALQQLLDRAYDSGRCSIAVDYARPPEPPLSPEQRAWAEAILREKGLLP